MDTGNPDQLQLLILSASPDVSIERTPCESENMSAIEVETVMMAEDAGILVPGDSTSLLKTIYDNSSSKKDTADDKQFKCLQCNKQIGFSGPSSLSRHIKTHSNEKPF